MKLWEAHAILRRYKLGVLATVPADREPSAALVGIAVARDLHVIFEHVAIIPEVPKPRGALGGDGDEGGGAK